MIIANFVGIYYKPLIQKYLNNMSESQIVKDLSSITFLFDLKEHLLDLFKIPLVDYIKYKIYLILIDIKNITRDPELDIPNNPLILNRGKIYSYLSRNYKD